MMYFLYLVTFSFSRILKDRNLSISLDGNWADTPLLSEAAAFIADVNGEAYWTFLKGLLKIEKGKPLPSTVEEIRSYSLMYLSDELRYLLELSLLTRSYSPRIEMFRQIASKYTTDKEKHNNIPFTVFAEKAYFSIAELEKDLDGAAGSTKSRPTVYPFEPRLGSSRDTVILYSPVSNLDILSRFFSLFEKYEETFSFVYRPIGIDTERPNKRVTFRGYGIEARPFNYSMTYLKKDLNEKLETGKESPDSDLIKSKHIVPGQKWPNYTTLPTQMIQFCKTTSDPFASLLEMSENFPLFASTIAKVPVVQSLTDRIMDKPERVIAGASAIYVNGRLIRTPDVFHILQASLDEMRIGQMLREHFGLSKESLNKSLHLQPDIQPPRKYIIDYRSSFLYSLNDIETGKAYQNWTTSLSSLMTKIPQRIKRNLFNVVFLIDPIDNSDSKILQWMDDQVRNVAPFRFSYFVTPRNSTRYAKRVLYAWAHIRLKYGADKAHQFLIQTRKSLAKDEKLKETHFRTIYQKMVNSKSSPKWQSLDELFAPKSRESRHIRKMRNHYEKLGISGPGMFFNGKYYPGKRNDRNVQQAFLNSLHRLRKIYMQNKFNNKTADTIDQIFTGDDVFMRFNPLVQHTDKSPSEFVPLVSQSFHFQREFMLWAKSLRYNSTSPQSHDVKFATFWVFVGEGLSNTMESRHIAMEIESFIGQKTATNTDTTTNGGNSDSMPSDARLAFFCDGGLHRIAMNAAPPPFVQDLLQLKVDEIAIVLNGRMIRMKGRTIFDWTSEDFRILLKWEEHRSMSMVKKFFAEDVDFNFEAIRDDVDSIDSSFHSQLALYLSFVYGFAAHNGIVRFPLDISIFNKEESPVVMNYRNDDSQLHFTAILNPLEPQFQATAPILKYFRDTKSFDVKIYLNFEKDADRKDFPQSLKGFHRFLLKENDHNIKQNNDNDSCVVFDRFDSETVYSIIPHPPENWMITPTLASFDLDNFKAWEMKPGVVLCAYRLTSILVEGSALDEQYIPVHGLRIILDMGDRGVFDSLSIKTMGYFQLQSQPGVWAITLGEGASQTVYNISSACNSILVSSFVPSWVSMLVHHNEGMTRYSIYDLPKDLRQPLTSPTPKSTSETTEKVESADKEATEIKKESKEAENDSIHIFIVISGELYEKLVKIMMISALRNTRVSPNRVKFWFLKNFISARFISDLSVFQQKYGFEYEFVQYHWPHWVQRQSERQRVIWGNKILFIDALFPTNLSRVIYIDADAVVRGDLLRLMKVDLKGKPYGFVPFCTSRKDMESFHFWTKGYWKRHLAQMHQQQYGSSGGGSMRYHISAMFVVDLERFRRMGAGDKLRKHYGKIVGNKQSLANLDQDLPNDAQDLVPIHSLPKRWLWCCTWCSEYEKDDALIIDLANNPKTKVSKIEMALKFIEEWPLLNEEAENFRNMTYFVKYNLTKIREEHRKLVGNEKQDMTTTSSSDRKKKNEKKKTEQISSEL